MNITQTMIRTRAAVIALAVSGSLALAQPATQPATQPAPRTDLSTQKTLYAVGYSHLDTQWRWAYPQVVREYVRNTLHDNFKLLEKYPNYVFNFSGSRRYEMMKEYYPADYEKLKKYIAEGRWFVCGSCVDEADAIVPSAESQVRHVLYGNRFSQREFGTTSVESMLPDCFGFPASLPTVLAHCGLRGFSTQKLTWGSAIGVPFKVGVWKGIDGNGVIAALDPGAYTGRVRDDLSQSGSWLTRINNTGNKSGVFADYHYFGTGDKGGAPAEESVQFVEKSVAGKGPVKVLSANAEQLYLDITDAQRERLPSYQGELLLTNHSAGSPTSQGYMKRWNRQNELLADAAERSSVIAAWLGAVAYPHDRLYSAWDLVLGSQMHDMLPGTSIPKAYEFCWNDELIALNQFGAVATDAVSAVAASLDTRVAAGKPLVVYNPLSIDREDAVEATVALPDGKTAVRVTDASGKPVPTQVLSIADGQARIAFTARVPSVGFAVFAVAPIDAAETTSELKVTDRTLENANFVVKLNNAGDIASIVEKKSKKEMLSRPARLAFQYENPQQYPAWNMDWSDRQKQPTGYVDGPATFKIAENGPARVAIEVTRNARGSRFVQRIQLASGEAGDRIDVVNTIDWNTPEHCLKATFPMSAKNPRAGYDLPVGVIERPNNSATAFEVPQHQWIDLTDTSAQFGMAVLNDGKYASDKPDNNTLRLTLLYTPGTRGGYADQGTQDFGRHQITYSLAPHVGDRDAGRVSWKARRLNQPLRAFTTTPHDGPLGKQFSLLKVDSDQVEVQAIKQAEDGDAIVVRLKHMTGEASADVTVSAAAPITSAKEVDGQERPIGDATLKDGKIVTKFSPFALRSFAVQLAKPKQPAAAPQSTPIVLSFDEDVASTDAKPADGSFDAEGRTFAAEQFPKTLTLDGITFKFGSTADGEKNALACHGQTIDIPAGADRLYVIAAAANGDRPVTFKVGSSEVKTRVQDWGGYIGQWDNRLWKTEGSEENMVGLVPGYLKTETVAWYSSHRHEPKTGNTFYDYSYMFQHAIDVPRGATSLTLPNDPSVRVFAISAAQASRPVATPASPLSDRLDDRGEFSPPTIDVADTEHDDALSVPVAHGLYFDQANLRFTTDGSEPKPDSPVYTEPLFVSRTTTLKVRQFAAGAAAGVTVEKTIRVNDRVAPKLLAATTVDRASVLTLAFSEPLDVKTAAVASNYRITPATEVTAATPSADGRSVVLTLDKPLPPGEAKVVLENLTDQSENANRVASEATPVQVAKTVVAVDSYKSDSGPMEMRVAGLPTSGKSPWTMSVFVRVERQPASWAAIAGFGHLPAADAGQGRYFVRTNDGLRFWADQRDVTSDARLDLNVWQMLTAVYDGKTLRLYKNGESVASEQVDLADDEPVVHLGAQSTFAEQNRRRFNGELAHFTVWDTALPADAIRQLAEQGLKDLGTAK